jgi:transposase-like protein
VKRRRNLTPDDRRTIGKLARAGRLPREIAQAIGCSRVTVTRVVSQLGLSRRRGGRRPQPPAVNYWKLPRAPMYVPACGIEWRV